MKSKVLIAILGVMILLAASSAWASPSVTLGTVTIDSGASGFNGIKAVCDGTTDITVSVDVTATFDTSGTCLNLGSGTKRTATGSGMLSVLANGVSLTNTTGNTWSGTLTVGPEGLNTVTVTATITDRNTTTSCSGSSTSPTDTGNASAKYVTDQTGPILTIRAYSPGPVAPATIPTISAGEAITVNVGLQNGSSGTDYSVSVSAHGPANLGPFTVNDSFGGPSGPNDDGIDKNEHVKDLSLQTLCSTPPGIYTMKVEANTQDLCGNAFATITKDPAETFDGDHGNDTSGTFEVLSPMQLGIITHVISEFPNGDYGIDQCFTSSSSKKKLTNNPGSVHIAAVVTSTVPADCTDSSITNPVITLTLPAGFSFLLTGNSPAAHVFIGVPNGGFDLHYPDGFIEVTSSAGISGQTTQTITVDLSQADVGFGPGVIPNADTIYVRAHASYTGPGAATIDSSYTFITSVTADGGLTDTDGETVIGNPSAGCLNGILEE